jgi:hypothetical protein
MRKFTVPGGWIETEKKVPAEPPKPNDEPKAEPPKPNAPAPQPNQTGKR